MSSTLSDSRETLQLLEQAAAGDALAVDRLFARHLPTIKKSVQRRLRPQTQSRFDVSDVIQDTHQMARRQFEGYLQRRPMSFKLWLLRAAHQRIVDCERVHLHAQIRSVNRELPLPDSTSAELAQQFLAPSPSPLEEAVLQEQARIVRQCLEKLTEADREVLLLRVFEGLKNVDVATLLELDPETTKKRFTRALIKLKRLLSDNGLGRGPNDES
jgi:RNA polymerase sigma-70 factor (ECF subfamily)